MLMTSERIAKAGRKAMRLVLLVSTGRLCRGSSVGDGRRAAVDRGYVPGVSRTERSLK